MHILLQADLNMGTTSELGLFYNGFPVTANREHEQQLLRRTSLKSLGTWERKRQEGTNRQKQVVELNG